MEPDLFTAEDIARILAIREALASGSLTPSVIAQAFAARGLVDLSAASGAA